MLSGQQLSADTLSSIGCLIAELEAGEMLYLPASWFHEVSKHSVLKNHDEKPEM
jgi:hypothetical protein